MTNTERWIGKCRENAYPTPIYFGTLAVESSQYMILVGAVIRLYTIRRTRCNRTQ